MESQHVPESTESADFQTSVRAEISREMVRLCKEQLGRGPTKARTEFAGPELRGHARVRPQELTPESSVNPVPRMQSSLRDLFV
jgi:hypothetical protein